MRALNTNGTLGTTAVRKSAQRLGALAFAFLLVGGVAACDDGNKSASEQAGDAVEDAGEATKDAGKAAGEAAKETVDKIKEKGEDMQQ